MRREVAAALAATVLSLCGCGGGGGGGSSTPAPRPQVPAGFVGVNLDPVLAAARGSLEGEVGRMAGAGVQTIRFPVYWDDLQPYPPGTRVSARLRSTFTVVDGVPTAFGRVDALVAIAARHHIALAPEILRAPGWAMDRSVRTGIPVPRDPARFGRFVAALAARYGTNGSFWAAHPDVPRAPITRWQIWNEPNNPYYFPRPFAPRYAALLRAVRSELKASDPGAQIVLGGLTNRTWDDLASLYRAGGRSLFDVAAINPYTAKVANVVQAAALTRGVMRRNGDGAKPLLLGELSWPASQGRSHSAFFAGTTDTGMAAKIPEAYGALVRRRTALGLTGAWWFTWLSRYRGPDAFAYSGLRRPGAGGFVDTPALGAFQRVAAGLEGR